MNRRQIPGTPVVDTVDRQAQRIVQHDVGRQVAVFGAESVTDPRSDRWPPGELAARLNFVERWFVREIRRLQRSDQRETIDLCRQMRHQLGNPHATLAVLRELERAAHQ